MQLHHPRGIRRTLFMLGSVIAMSALAVITIACDDEESAGPEVGVTIEDILDDDADDLLGDTVTISGEVDELVAPNALVLEAGLLVLAPQQGTPQAGGDQGTATGDGIANAIAEADEGDVIRVDGTVQQFVFEDVDTYFAPGFDEETAVEFDDRPYVEIESVEILENESDD